MSEACKHCRSGYLGNRFGEDVECVNGILIDIDVAHEGWQSDTNYPVAPCHPMWARQQAGDDSFYNDTQERLEAWAQTGQEDVEGDTGSAAQAEHRDEPSLLSPDPSARRVDEGGE